MTTYDYPTIYWEELQGMRQRAMHYLNNGTRSERRMAKNILKLVAWVECEGKANQEKMNEGRNALDFCIEDSIIYKE